MNCTLLSIRHAYKNAMFLISLSQHVYTVNLASCSSNSPTAYEVDMTQPLGLI